MPKNNSREILPDTNVTNKSADILHKDYGLFAKNLENDQLKANSSSSADSCNEETPLKEQNADYHDLASLERLDSESNIPEVPESFIKVNEETGRDVDYRNDQHYTNWPMDEGSGEDFYHFDPNSSDYYDEGQNAEERSLWDEDNQNLNTTVEDIFNSTDGNLKYPENNSSLIKHEDNDIIHRWLQEQQEDLNSTDVPSRTIESENGTNSKSTVNNQDGQISSKLKLLFGKSYDLHNLKDILFPNGLQLHGKNVMLHQILNQNETFPLKLASAIFSKMVTQDGFQAAKFLDLISGLKLDSILKQTDNKDSTRSQVIKQARKDEEIQNATSVPDNKNIDIKVKDQNETQTELFEKYESARNDNTTKVFKADDVLFSVKLTNQNNEELATTPHSNEQPDKKNIGFHISATFIPINVNSSKTKRLKSNKKLESNENNQTEIENSGVFKVKDLNNERPPTIFENEIKSINNESIQTPRTSKVLLPMETPLVFEVEDINKEKLENSSVNNDERQANGTVFGDLRSNEHTIFISQEIFLENKNNLANNKSVPTGNTTSLK